MPEKYYHKSLPYRKSEIPNNKKYLSAEEMIAIRKAKQEEIEKAKKKGEINNAKDVIKMQKNRLEKKQEKDSVNYGQKKVEKLGAKETEESKVLWGPAYYPLPGQRYSSIDAGAKRVEVYLGDDCRWHVDGKKVSDIYALELIESDETRVDYIGIVEDIKKLIEDNKKP